jgi:hypothetical protein
MAYTRCLDCRRLVKQPHRGRCWECYRGFMHNRGGRPYSRMKNAEIAASPRCYYCGHEADGYLRRCADIYCDRCPLTLDHVDRMRDTKGVDTGRHRVACRKCNRERG